MSKVIGREQQKKILIDAINSEKSELIALYGRRRVGKTFLIRETYSDDIVIEFSGIYKGSFAEQIANFQNEITKRNPQLTTEKPLNNWFEAFNLLGVFIDNLKKRKKKVIFIDEFPWMHTPRSKFVQMFGHFWNNYCSKRNDLVVVICGSAASFMVRNVIYDKGGLHNRISYSMRLLPFNLNETRQFLASKNIRLDYYDCALLYMALGGIPHYLDKIQPGDSVPVAIDRLCFQKDGLLENEFNQIFHSLFEHPTNYIKVVETLSELKQGMSRDELLTKSGIPSGGAFTDILRELSESGFISEYQPFNKKKKDTLYRLTDEYSLFYLKFIKNKTGRSWLQLSQSRSYATWSGLAFETLCLKHVSQIKKGLGISGIDSCDTSWRNENAQIDLLIDRSDRCVNICEIKFSITDFTLDKQYVENIKNKKQEFLKSSKSKKNIFITFITTFGVKTNSYTNTIIDNQLTINCLFD